MANVALFLKVLKFSPSSVIMSSFVDTKIKPILQWGILPQFPGNNQTPKRFLIDEY